MALHDTHLRGGSLRLDPMDAEEAGELLAAAGSPETFRWFTRPPRTWDTGGMRAYAAHLLDHPDIRPFTIRDAGTGRVIGSTSLCDIRPEHRTAEIGWTWYAPASRGTRVNPECKLLLLEYAFSGALFGRPAIRVCFKADSRNERSVRAISALGAVREGVLRSHVIMPDGYRRDSACFSIIEEEWPHVRDRIRARLGKLAGARADGA